MSHPGNNFYKQTYQQTDKQTDLVLEVTPPEVGHLKIISVGIPVNKYLATAQYPVYKKLLKEQSLIIIHN